MLRHLEAAGLRIRGVSAMSKPSGGALGAIPTFFEAGTSVLSFLAACIVGFSALAYVAGHQFLASYYSGVHASWVLGLLPPFDIAFAAMPAFVYAVAILLLVIVKLTMPGESKPLTASIIIFLVLLASVVALWLAAKRWDSRIIPQLFILFGLGASVMACNLVAALLSNKKTHAGWRFALLALTALVVVMVLPMVLGKLTASRKVEFARCSLPSVKYRDSARGAFCKDLRLFTTTADKFVLTCLDTGKPDHFSVASHDDIFDIRAVRNDAEFLPMPAACFSKTP